MNHVTWNHLNHTVGFGAFGSNPNLAAQSIMGLWPQRRGRLDRADPGDPALAGQNLIPSQRLPGNLGKSDQTPPDNEVLQGPALRTYRHTTNI